MAFCVTLLEANGTTSTLVFDQDVVSIGRASQNDVRPDPVRYSQVSRNHGRIVRKGPEQFYYEDLGSTQGSWFEGRVLHARHILDRDDCVTLGEDGPTISITWPRPRVTGVGGTHYKLPGTKPSVAFPLAFSEDFYGIFGRYDKIGAGGFGEVWCATPYDENASLQAVKLIHPSLLAPDRLSHEDRQSLVQRFAREIRVTSGLSTSGAPAIPRVHRWGDDPGRDFLYLTMDFIHGTPLDQIVRSRRTMPLGESARYMAQVAGALHAAHNFEFRDENDQPANGIIHRDVKPGNILIDEETRKAWIVDFGVAGFLEGGERLTGTNITVGTHLYLPPEAFVRQLVNPAIDLWGFTVTLYMVLTAGKFPWAFGSSPMEAMENMASGALTPVQSYVDLPKEIASAVNLSLNPDPQRRVQSAAQWVELLGRYAE